MPRRRDERARVLGPTWCKDKEAWRATILQSRGDEPGHRRTYRYFGIEKQAQDWIEETRAKLVRLEGTTFEAAFKGYEQHLRDQGNKEASTKEAMRRLGLFFGSVLKMQVARLRPERASELYAAFRGGKAVDYHRDSLSRARGFLNWCVEQGWVTENALAKVKGVGKKKTGKPQFTGDEARKWFAYCIDRACRRDTAANVRRSDTAIGLLMLILMALRQSDVLRRQVRDVDLGGTILRVERGKTRKSNRPRKVPAVLRPFLLALAAGRPANDLLFGYHTNSWLYRAQHQACREAGVPYICPHALKGTAGSILAETGELADKIADHLSHERTAVTERHYIAPGIIDGVQASRAIDVLFPVPNPVPRCHGTDATPDSN